MVCEICKAEHIALTRQTDWRKRGEDYKEANPKISMWCRLISAKYGQLAGALHAEHYNESQEHHDRMQEIAASVERALAHLAQKGME